jgi:Transcriptional regulators
MLFLNYTPKLNETQKEIYTYISHNLELVCHMSLRELAKNVHVSQTVVWRFCEKFETSGYAEFKFKLKQYMEDRKKISTDYSLDETTLINFVRRSTEQELKQKLEAASDILAEKEFVIFLGEGSSKIIGEYGAIYFSSLYNLSVCISHPLFNPVSRLNPDSAQKFAVIALSVSGETDKVLNNLEYFAELGTSIISITNSENTSIAHISDVNIPYYLGIEKNRTADVTSQVPALFLIEKLAKNVANKLNQV